MILIGFAASYKTTVGKILGRHLRVEFIDTDIAVEKALGESVADIFAKRGEAAFRIAESQTLKKLKNTAGVISCGGGAVLSSEFEVFAHGATVVWLQTSARSVRERLQQGTRPLFDALDASELQQLITLRTPYYQKYAAFSVSTDDKTAEQVAEEVLQLLE